MRMSYVTHVADDFVQSVQQMQKYQTDFMNPYWAFRVCMLAPLWQQYFRQDSKN